MYGVVIIFKNFSVTRGILGSDWVNPIWLHFQRAFSSMIFRRTLGNPIIINVGKLIKIHFTLGEARLYAMQYI